jgi:hypothetical protein
LTERVADPWLLDLDDVGAEIRQQHAGDATGHHPRQIEDPHAAQRFHAFDGSCHICVASAMLYLFSQ